VFFYSNQTLIFEGGATLLQGASMDNLMMNYSTAEKGNYDATDNVIIRGATFDGGSYSQNNTLLGICHSRNITIENCRFRNAYGTWHNLEINSSKHVLVDGCWFEGSRKNGVNGELIQIDSFNNTATWPWGNGKVDGTVSYLVEVKNCFFAGCTIAPAIGNHSQAVIDSIRIHDNVFEGFTSSRGAVNFQSAKNVDVYCNTFTGCTTGITIGTADNTNTVHDNRFIGITTVVGNGIRSYSNMINGTFTT
jgi:nitrous oxidase accessory protein NosD